ncbi:hypothetical protein KDH_07420 [Dictyobacter sp. S3.2.2.5]|uniref:Menorin-like domain-containing protein n=1 Tax=Dictyobacter halimunensis TaxID=3026934 RepID=A0ABQ6FMY6_9CHLR|nr:hypothetical protein KDH_07420 [Dictyobacter sp. S3.2.2.5]
MKDVMSYLKEHYDIDVLGDITWAHAVNSQQRLRDTLNNPQIMMLEVDVILSANGEVVLGHPPVLDSDLHFDAFIDTVANSRQGIKLDLKDPEVLLPCLTKLRDSGLRQPVLLNAGVVPGNDGMPPKFNTMGFFAACKKLYPQGILSPDWTNEYAPLTEKNIDAMLNFCQDFEQVTFPVNARLLPFSWTQLTRLLQHDGYSLTIWDGKPVDKYLKLWLRENTDPTRVCYDCADENGQTLHWW